MDWQITLARLRADRKNWRAAAQTIGTSTMQLRRIADGQTTRPRIDTAQKIASYYESREKAAA